MAWQQKKNRVSEEPYYPHQDLCWNQDFYSSLEQGSWNCPQRISTGHFPTDRPLNENGAISFKKNNQTQEQELNYEEVFRNIDEDEEDTNIEDDDSYNTNIDVVGSRSSFLENERLQFMASQRIHYYKCEEVNELLNVRNLSCEGHFDNIRNIIMSMSNNYGGLIMFGLGKNKTVQGLQLTSSQRNEFVKLFTNLKNTINGSQHLNCTVTFIPIYVVKQVATSQAYQLFDNSVLQEEQKLFAPFSNDNQGKTESSWGHIWNEPSTMQHVTLKTKEWVPNKFVVRVCIDQGKKLDETYVYLKNKEMTSAIFDKQLKIFKTIYGAPLVNKIISKAKVPCQVAQKLILAEPDKEGLFASDRLVVIEQTKEECRNTQNQEEKSEFLFFRDVNSEELALTQEGIKYKRGQKILNDSKMKMIKEKKSRYQQSGEEKNSARKGNSNQNIPKDVQGQENDISPITVRVEFVGFEHSCNTKSLCQYLESLFGPCIIPPVTEMYDTLFFEARSFQRRNTEMYQTLTLSKKPSLTQSSSQRVSALQSVSSDKEEKQFQWIERLKHYLLLNDHWITLITKNRFFKKCIIDGREYSTDESKEWVCFQNVKNKSNFQAEITELLQKNVVDRVNFYHQHIFRVIRQSEFDSFCAENIKFQQCFVADTIKRGFSTSRIVIKGLKNSPKVQEVFKNLLNNCSFNIPQQGPSFFVCEFRSPLDCFISMERLINHRKQKFLSDLFTSGHLDTFIELSDQPKH